MLQTDWVNKFRCAKAGIYFLRFFLWNTLENSIFLWFIIFQKCQVIGYKTAEELISAREDFIRSNSIFLNQSSEWWMLKFTLAEELSTNSKLSPSLLLDLANASVGIIPNNWPKYPHARARVPTTRNRTKFWSRTKAIGFCPKYSKKTDTQFSSKLGWTNSPIGNILSMLLSDLTRQHGWYGFVEHTWTNSI